MSGAEQIQPLPQPLHDVYIAAADRDLIKAERIAAALRSHNLDVVFDDGMQPNVLSELDQSRLLLAYYSRNFSDHPRCNAALLKALSAGHIKGDPKTHIAPLNPDDPYYEHITPIDVANIKYIIPGSDNGPLINALKKKLLVTTKAIGETALLAPPRWMGRDAITSTSTTERYRELWQLHNALQAQEYPFMAPNQMGGVAALCGPSGVGKTDLAEAYVNLLGARYQGGIYWISLRGCEPTAAAIDNRMAEELRHASKAIDLDQDTPSEYLAQDIGHRMYSREAQSLWVFDDIPDVRDKAAIKALLAVPGSHYLHQIFISRQNILRDYMESVVLLHR